MPGCLVTSAQQVVDQSELVFVTTPDAAIQAVVAGLRWRSGVAVVHCSGATELDALSAARAQGAEVGGFHPLQSVADPVVAARTLPGCTITIEAQGPLLGQLTQLAARLGCPVNTLPPGQRAAYHAAAGYASQFVHVLMAEAAYLWRQWGATEDQALQALLPLLRGTVASLQAKGVAGGMPGPVSRGDLPSVVRHLAALDAIDRHQGAGASVATGVLYRSLCLRSVPLAERRGGIDALQAAALRALLQQPPVTDDTPPA